ncbi:hypothetical protein Pint_09918 [Pistacia integerrima]|uniref:Uncharacterized protein n=1 Tax=Pistacia integerrima TaxID=434235 RepID=A0ACC0XMP0_9ROSI|nr:hypothetical protein Pint_09918 [Pistacia integerrima]
MTRKWDEKLGFEEDKGSEENHNQNNTNNVENNNATMVPALDHNGKIIGESIDLIEYVDSNFEGPSLFPDDRDKKKLVEESLSYTDTFNRDVYTSFKGDPDSLQDVKSEYAVYESILFGKVLIFEMGDIVGNFDAGLAGFCEM